MSEQVENDPYRSGTITRGAVLNALHMMDDRRFVAESLGRHPSLDGLIDSVEAFFGRAASPDSGKSSTVRLGAELAFLIHAEYLPDESGDVGSENREAIPGWIGGFRDDFLHKWQRPGDDILAYMRHERYGELLEVYDELFTPRGHHVDHIGFWMGFDCIDSAVDEYMHGEFNPSDGSELSEPPSGLVGFSGFVIATKDGDVAAEPPQLF